MAGSKTLINATIANSTMYLMSPFHMPAQVANRLDQIMRNFLWSGQADKTKFHLVAWDNVCLPKQQGGLGIRILRKHNQALLGKWWWCLATQPNSLWAQVLRKKYNIPEGAWLPSRNHWHNASRAWRSFASALYQFIRFHPREGSRVRFWFDLWLGPSPLKEVYPTLYSLEQNKESSVAEEMVLTGGQRVWNPSFRRNLTEEEFNHFQSLSTSLHSHFLSPQGSDAIIWTLAPFGIFSVASFYKGLILPPTLPANPTAIKSKVWTTIAPSKVQTFNWLACSHRALTVDQLQKREIPLPNKCALCLCEEESSQHLFILCDFSFDLWGQVLQLLVYNGSPRLRSRP
ncbi:hypothetical protein AMTRI_Chr11g154720 [Amborella trichopoda]